MCKKKKLTCTQLERKNKKEFENELCRDWKVFREIVLEDNKKPLKYHKVDVCKAIKNFVKTSKAKIHDTIELPSNDELREQAERMWNIIVCYEKHVQGK